MGAARQAAACTENLAVQYVLLVHTVGRCTAALLTPCCLPWVLPSRILRIRNRT